MARIPTARSCGLNESPSEKEGKCVFVHVLPLLSGASMKALPKRKGNRLLLAVKQPKAFGLNESPSEKEGKWACRPPSAPRRRAPQ